MKKLTETKSNIYQRFQLDNKMPTNKRFLDLPPITPSSTGITARYVPGDINERRHSYGTNQGNVDFLSHNINER